MNKKTIIIALLAIISITSSVAQEKDSVPSISQQRADSLLMAHFQARRSEEWPDLLCASL